MVYIILSTTTWYLWIERNNRLFLKKSLHKSFVLKRIKDSIKVRTLHKIFLVPSILDFSSIAQAFGLTLREKEKTASIVTWLVPPSGWFKLNTDGSLSDDRGGYVALLRNNNADFIAGLAGRLDLHSINLLELKAIERGIQLGLSNAVTNLWIESDSITAIAWVHGRGCIPWTALRSIRQIHQGLHHLKCWKATHIHRECNSPADLLAAHRSSRGETLLRPQQLWIEIRTAIEEDKLLRGYERISWSLQCLKLNMAS
ncbi:hypothetical protein QJS04_geneDACA022453 [Acorus gramineus]|uniref:RNase H type-1 domain-containing protein n=1 Tax=Acorus gramineus TaxID=55184 RepID=A0AAV9ALW0_ACOGR|nr:hypothetical protein QJS04_geneDACA022453 [Acorus gramineus]